MNLLRVKIYNFKLFKTTVVQGDNCPMLIKITQITGRCVTGNLSGGASPSRGADQDSTGSFEPGRSTVPRTEGLGRVLQLSASNQRTEEDRTVC